MNKKQIFCLKKSERLHKRKEINKLFTSASAIYLPILHVKYLILPFEMNINKNPKVIFLVGKKKIKKAVKRNQIRRKIKEAYRLNKESLNPFAKNYLIYIAYIYNGLHYPFLFSDIQREVIQSIKIIQNKLSSKKV